MLTKNRFHEAWLLQDACNIRGVARALVEIADDAARDAISTGDVAKDDAVIAVVSKLADMVGLSLIEVGFESLGKCKREYDAVEAQRRNAS